MHTCVWVCVRARAHACVRVIQYPVLLILFSISKDRLGVAFCLKFSPIETKTDGFFNLSATNFRSLSVSFVCLVIFDLDFSNW